MYARVVTNQIQPGKMDEWLGMISESIVPSLKEQSSFLGFVVLVDRGNYRQQIAKLGPVLAGPPVREAYELTVVA